MKQRVLKSLVNGGGRCPFLFALELMPIGAGQMYIEVNNLCYYIITKSGGETCYEKSIPQEGKGSEECQLN